MTFTKAITVGALALFAFIMPVHAEEDLSIQGMLSLSKLTGACGILNSMIQFQETTKLDNGEIFVVRFWATEAARLGMTSTELAMQCNKSVTAYDKLWKLVEQEK